MEGDKHHAAYTFYKSLVILPTGNVPAIPVRLSADLFGGVAPLSGCIEADLESSCRYMICLGHKADLVNMLVYFR